MNDKKQLLTEERAVTPVIGIILVVAIAVVLGAVVSAYALGTTNDVGAPAPQASFDFTVNEATGDIVVTKSGGDTIDGDQLKFSGAALEKTAGGSITEWAGKGVKAGDSAAVNVMPGESLELIWRSPDSSKTAMIAEYDVPDDVGPTASIGGLSGVYPTTSTIIVNSIQFTKSNKVWVVLEDENDEGGVGRDAPTQREYFSSNGGDLPFDIAVNYNYVDGETVTVTVYETNSEKNKLATATKEV